MRVPFFLNPPTGFCVEYPMSTSIETIRKIGGLLESEDSKEKAVGKGMLVMYLEMTGPAPIGNLEVGQPYTVTFVSWNRARKLSRRYHKGGEVDKGTPHIKDRPIVFGGIEAKGKKQLLVCTLDYDGHDRRWYRVEDILIVAG